MSLPVSLTRWIITLVAVSMSVFHLYVAFFGPPDAYVMRGLHLAFAQCVGLQHDRQRIALQALAGEHIKKKVIVLHGPLRGQRVRPS